jgi:hypothetical protein
MRVVRSGLLLWMVLSAGLAAQGQDGRFSSAKTLSAFALYSNNSGYLFLGIAEDRRLVGAGLGYSRRLIGHDAVEWDWEAEVRPVNFYQEPWTRGTVTLVTAVGYDPGNEGPFEYQVQRNCTSGSYTNLTYVGSNGDYYVETTSQTCYRKWTYAGGISPLGQRVSFFKKSRLQPFIVANAGALISPRDMPSHQSSRLNFTFEGGGGVEWFTDHRHSIALDYRVQHLSNAWLGVYNPGIDNQVLRLSYRLGRD